MSIINKFINIQYPIEFIYYNGDNCINYVTIHLTYFVQLVSFEVIACALSFFFSFPE